MTEPSALFIIDLQRDFLRVDGRMPVHPAQAEEIIFNINALVSNAARLHLEPVYINNAFDPLDPLNLFRRFAAVAGSSGAQMDERVTVSGEHQFLKRTENALSNPALVAFLRSGGVRHVYLTGLYAQACVFQTFRGLRRAGLTCTVVSDAVASHSSSARDRALERMQAAGASPISTAALLG
jgi:nicotinamidase-related amidase